jgi:hypothetical protein
MGFLDKLTGGGATIQIGLQKNRFAIGENVPVWVTVTANSNIKYEAIVLHIWATETVRTPNCPQCRTNVPDPTERVYNNEINIAGPGTMYQGETRQFQGAIQIPHGSPPTYRGRNANTIWHLEARASMFGNDPDTRVEIQVYG